jgi:hypothetical protein
MFKPAVHQVAGHAAGGKRLRKEEAEMNLEQQMHLSFCNREEAEMNLEQHIYSSFCNCEEAEMNLEQLVYLSFSNREEVGMNLEEHMYVYLSIIVKKQKWIWNSTCMFIFLVFVKKQK